MIPLEAALIAINGLNPTTTLFGVGIAYLLAGAYFRIPMPVQPLKALAVIAIAHQSPPTVIAAAALLMAGALAALSLTNAIRTIERAVPVPVVRGVQLGLGFLLVKGAYQMIFQKPFFLGGENVLAEVAGVSMPLGIILGLGSALLLVLVLRLRPVPAAVLVIVLGVLSGLMVSDAVSGWRFGPAPLAFEFPSPGDFLTALVLLVIPQLPLTLANSVMATADAAKTYFGEQAKRATPSRIAFSVAVGNLWAGLTGGLPNCHGCGGLTAHYRLGARTPLATAVLGTVLIVIAIVFGRSAMEVRNLLPAATLGALLLYVGIQHVFLGLNVKATPHLLLVVLIAAVSMAAGGNLAIGAAAGLVLYWGIRWTAARYGLRLADRPAERPVFIRVVGALERIVPSA
ncbi:MAG: hypothetical protein HY678_09160 [Chloroflexi bacterium]|nr:hypothetical protein [Chloroflexota bacterium]